MSGTGFQGVGVILQNSIFVPSVYSFINKIRAGFVCLALIFCIALPSPSQAAIGGADLSTVRDALNGDFTAISTMQTLTNNHFLGVNGVRNRLIGDFGNLTNAIQAFDDAIGGDKTALAAIQGSIGANEMTPPLDTIDMGPMNPADPADIIAERNINFIVGGSGNTAIMTVELALAGNARALQVLRYIFNLSQPNIATSFINQLPNAFPFPDKPAVIASGLDARAGVPEAMNAWIKVANDLSYAYSGLLSGGFVDSNTIDWIQSLSDDLTYTSGVGGAPGTPGLPGSPGVGAGGTPIPPVDEYVEGTPSTGAGGGGCATITGTNPNATFTGSFATDPSNTTCDNRNLTFVKDYEGGQQFVNYLRDWWNNEMLPAMRDFTAQINSGIIDQTRQFGSMIDSMNQAETQRQIQKAETEAIYRNMPNDLSCTSATFTDDMTKAQYTSDAISRAMKDDLRRELMATSGTTVATSGTGGEMKERWDEYCQYFKDPQENRGHTGCPTAAAGSIAGADINIEGFLLSDTINMDNPNEHMAAVTTLRHLIYPKPDPTVPENMVDTALGREILLRQQHKTSVRNLAAEIVSDIIARRTAINGTTAGTYIQPIREAAGIPAAEISMNPSYNEIMLAMTKERFMDPEYFVRLGNTMGAIKQEQTMLDAYIALQLQDIYEMQEKINALMVAKAAMKLNEGGGRNLSTSAPMQ